MSFQGSLSPTPFTVTIPNQHLADLKTLIQLSRLPPPTYEGTQAKYGVTSAWMRDTKDYWLNKFDWRKHEKRINGYSNYTVDIVDDDGSTLNIHFIASLSSDPKAIPIVLLHGWPGSFLEFLDVISILSASTSPSFNIIVPSLPGYAFSSVPVDKEFGLYDASRIVDKLMVGLGYGSGYLSQGGDVGSFISTILGANYTACKGVHLNSSAAGWRPPSDADELPITDREKEGLANAPVYSEAYALEHAQRPSTIGHVLASNPLALLAWIGEKFLDWTDETPSLDSMLESITLYWFTKSFPRGIYPYRNMFVPTANPNLITPPSKPLGYSWFPREIIPTPASWVRKTGNLVFVQYHDKGGHFAALEQPKDLVADIIEFANKVKGDFF